MGGLVVVVIFVLGVVVVVCVVVVTVVLVVLFDCLFYVRPSDFYSLFKFRRVMGAIIMNLWKKLTLTGIKPRPSGSGGWV